MRALTGLPIGLQIGELDAVGWAWAQPFVPHKIGIRWDITLPRSLSVSPSRNALRPTFPTKKGGFTA
jgi:hypothetical protein